MTAAAALIPGATFGIVLVLLTGLVFARAGVVSLHVRRPPRPRPAKETTP